MNALRIHLEFNLQWNSFYLKNNNNNCHMGGEKVFEVMFIFNLLQPQDTLKPQTCMELALYKYNSRQVIN